MTDRNYLSLPARFVRDQIERGLDVGEPHVWTRNSRVWISMTAEQYAESLDDAEFYAAGHADCDPNLRHAAKRLVAALLHEYAFITN